FMQDEFGWKRETSALSFGIIILILGMPTVLFFKYGVFDEYDYWAGTVSLVVFALVESVLFAWVFGINKGWREITLGSDIRLPGIYKFIIKYITPALLLAVFLGALVTPEGGDWSRALSGDWVLDNSSIIRQVTNFGLRQEIAAATDLTVKAALEKKLLYVTGSRLLLLAVFFAICYLVFVAHRRRKKLATVKP
ncbi:MAG: sodium:calcium symporter, partial [Chitinophagaceae bacterium]